MRSTQWICVMAALACAAGVHSTSAQVPDDGWKSVPSTTVRAPLPERVSDHLIHAREAELARQRTARIEARKWMGISTGRPRYFTGYPVYVNYPFWYSPVVVIPPQPATMGVPE